MENAVFSGVSLVNTVNGDRIILNKDRVLVGRQVKADHVRLKSRLVNRIHALFDKNRQDVRLADLGSRNGTWLNGRLLTPGTYAELTDGDEIMFADEVFRFERKERIIHQYEKDVSDHGHARGSQHPYVRYL